MLNSHQRGHDAAPTRRQRMGARLCILLMLFAFGLQATHTHGTQLTPETPFAQMHAAATTGHAAASPEKALQANGEVNCPLCAAMHGMVAARPAMQYHQDAVQAAVAVALADFRLNQPWHFSLLSRPPPTTQL